MYNYTRLIKWAQQQIGKKFEWGITDCATITIKALEVFHGNSLFPELSKWSSKQTALKVYTKEINPTTFFTKKGFKEIGKKFEQTGDVIIFKTEPLETIGVIINSNVLGIDDIKGVMLKALNEIDIEYSCFRRVC